MPKKMEMFSPTDKLHSVSVTFLKIGKFHIKIQIWASLWKKKKKRALSTFSPHFCMVLTSWGEVNEGKTLMQLISAVRCYPPLGPLGHLLYV